MLQINVVSEKRLYPSWSDDSTTNTSSVNLSTGFISVRKALNKIHGELSENGFDQVIRIFLKLIITFILPYVNSWRFVSGVCRSNER